MNRFLLFLPLWLSGCIAFSQQPGGVSAPLFWYETARDARGCFWQSAGGSPQSPPALLNQADGTLNYHPALRLLPEAPSQERWPLPGGRPVELFTVCQAKDSINEQVLWSLRPVDGQPTLMTTHRIADLKQFHYMNYPGQHSGEVVLKHFFQSKLNADSSRQRWLQWGALEGRHRLPVQNLQGLLPEWIAFDRLLSAQERQQVYSYLALKYGICLRSPDPVNYLDSRGQIVWEGARQAAYHHRVAGIAWDPGSGLYQSQSTSSHAAGQLVISLEDSLPAPHSFLVWGDNGRPMQWAEPQPLHPTRLQREWLLQITGPLDSLPTQLTLDTRIVFEPPQGHERYWLAVDYSGSGQFRAEQTAYFPLGQSGEKQTASGLRWGSRDNDRAVFSLAKGPDMIVHATAQQPRCDGSSPGSLNVKMAGGQAPYRLTLSHGAGSKRTQTIPSAGTLARFSKLLPGSYQLLVSDSQGEHFRREFFLSSEGGPEIPLRAQYSWDKGSRLLLNARPSDGGNNWQYEWRKGAEVFSQAAQAEIKASGQYEVVVYKEGCVKRHRFDVTGPASRVFHSIQLMPNPVAAGSPFRVDVRLREAALVNMRLFDASGRLVCQEQQENGLYCQFRRSLPRPGTYLLQLSALGQTTTLRLIVQS